MEGLSCGVKRQRYQRRGSIESRGDGVVGESNKAENRSLQDFDK